MGDSETPTLERILHNDRKIVLSTLIVVVLAAWAWLLAGAGMDMSGFEMTRHNLMGMDMMTPATWTFPYAILMFTMWWIMMIAMMLPSASPVILLAAGINRRSDADTQPFGSVAAFVLGYLLSWAGFSLAAVAAQWSLEKSQLINGMMQSSSKFLTAIILIAAGAWQFTPWKHSCLRHCRGPVEFLTRYRRPGNSGALAMGMRHGLYCLGCCWFLMALLFVGGVMNLAWVAGIALYVWIEKAAPAGMWVSRLVGASLVASGALILTA